MIENDLVNRSSLVQDEKEITLKSFNSQQSIKINKQLTKIRRSSQTEDFLQIETDLQTQEINKGYENSSEKENKQSDNSIKFETYKNNEQNKQEMFKFNNKNEQKILVTERDSNLIQMSNEEDINERVSEMNRGFNRSLSWFHQIDIQKIIV